MKSPMWIGGKLLRSQVLKIFQLSGDRMHLKVFKTEWRHLFFLAMTNGLMLLNNLQGVQIMCAPHNSTSCGLTVCPTTATYSDNRVPKEEDKTEI